MSHPLCTDHVVAVGDAELFVRRLAVVSPADSGAAPTLVFLHDSLGCVDAWRQFPQQLATQVGLDALIYDRQGYGRSSAFGAGSRTLTYLADEAKVLLQLLEVLAIKSAVLFGHSDGGSIALLAAGLRPDRVAAVVTEGAHVFVEALTLAGIQTAQHALATTDLPQRLARYHGEKVQGLVAAWIDTWLSPAFRWWNIEAQLRDVVCPVLVIQGEHDEFGTIAQVNAIVTGVGGAADSLMIPGIGHTPHREARDTVLRAAASFIGAAVDRWSRRNSPRGPGASQPTA
jgi:pimeloyl-ACP methyl ester carboxylesterase